MMTLFVSSLASLTHSRLEGREAEKRRGGREGGEERTVRVEGGEGGEGRGKRVLVLLI